MIASKANNSVQKNWSIRLMRYANIKKASQDEQQNQTTTTNHYIKKILSFLKNKNLITKSKYRQIKLKLNKNIVIQQKIFETSPQ